MADKKESNAAANAEILTIAFGKIVIGILLLGLGIIGGTLSGWLCGWIVSWFFQDVLVAALAGLGIQLHCTIAQLGALLGFVGGFIRPIRFEKKNDN